MDSLPPTPQIIPAENLPSSNQNFNKKKIFWFGGIFAILVIFYFLFLRAPGNFPGGVIINVPEGASLHRVSLELKNENIIRSRTAFEAFIIFYGGDKHIIPADYFFEKGVPVFEVARRVSRGERHLAPVAVTIPEGFNILEIADAFTSKLPNFDKEKFLTVAKEGYMFPDTYFFFTTDDEQVALRLMSTNFEKKVAPLRSEMASMGKTEKDIITMASVIEREAKGEVKGTNDRGFISGILWHRLAIGMPLQVDAALETYKVKGLPKNPICNPGLEAIKAAIHPEKSSYLYYLHDKEGGIHYAKSFAEHKANIQKYLK